jgi:hypothetical protein
MLLKIYTITKTRRHLLKRFVLVFFCAQFFVSCADEVVYEDELKEIAFKLNQKCPQMIDSETRIDGLEVKEPVTLVYKYTLMNLDVKNVDTAQFRRALWPGLLSNTKISGDMKKLRDNNTTLLYAYADKYGKAILTVTITPKDYK